MELLYCAFDAQSEQSDLRYLSVGHLTATWER